jgi:ABC-2 type transport system ATP-binding protein
VIGLQKSFADNKVLTDVSFSLKKGEILALLGPNGAGKTTTVNILSTLLLADEGSATVNGFDVAKDDDKVRAQIGLTGQFAAVDEYLTGRENIEMIAKLYHMERSKIAPKAQQLLEKFDLIEAGDRPARTYSGGMKRRLDLAMSLVASPPILFLDEPTTGLDPRSRLTLWELVQELADEGVSILLTTQYMEEAEYLANNVIVLDQGAIIAEGTVNQLKSKAGSERIEITLESPNDVPTALKILGKTATHNKATDLITVPAKKGTESLRETIKKLEAKNISIDTVGLRKPTLDDVFLALTGHVAEDRGTKEMK